MWTSTKSRFDFELVGELRKNGTKRAAASSPGGRARRRSTGCGRRAIHASKTALLDATQSDWWQETLSPILGLAEVTMAPQIFLNKM